MPNVSPLDTLAAQFRGINQRLASLERASGSGGGGGGVTDASRGVVATGTWPAGTIDPTVNVSTPISNPLNWTPVLGRRYRVTVGIRAHATIPVAFGSYRVEVYNSGVVELLDRWRESNGNYAGSESEWLFTGDGVARSWTVNVLASQAGQRFWRDGCLFYVEDVGPVAGADPVPEIPWVQSAVPSGTIIQGVWTSDPTGYLLLDGRAIANADALHPNLWAVAPASWKSGTTLTLPNSEDMGRVLMTAGLGAVPPGTVDGENSVTLSAANMPSHLHSMAHTHPINHDHPTFNTTVAGSHIHEARFLTTATGSGTNADLARPYNATYTFQERINATGDGGLHQHAIDVPAFTGTSGASSAASTGTAGSTTPTPVPIAPARIRVKMAIKT